MQAQPKRARNSTACELGQLAGRSSNYRSGNKAPKCKADQWSDDQMNATMAVVEKRGKIQTIARYFDKLANTHMDLIHSKILQRKKDHPQC